MIEINLLPQHLRKRKKRVKVELPKLKFLPFALAALAFVAAIQLFLFGSIVVKKRQNIKLAQTWKELLPSKNEIDKIKQEHKDLKVKEYTIGEFVRKKMLWAKKLNDLSDSVAPGIWLTDVSIKEEIIQEPPPPVPRGTKVKKYRKRVLNITGRAVSAVGGEAASIGEFVKSLKENEGFFEHFSSVELSSSKTVRIRTKAMKYVEVMEFVLACPFRGREEVL